MAKHERYPEMPQVVVPETGVMPLRTLDDYRDALHRLTNTLVPVLVTYGVVTDTWVAIWIPVAFGVVDPILSVLNTGEKLRRVVYGVGGFAQTALITFGVLTESVAATVVGAVVTFATSYIASKFTVDGTVTAA